MTELTKHKLSDLYTLASGISSSKDQAGHGQPFLSFSTAFNNVFLPDTLPDLMASNEKEQEKHSIKCGDVFLTRTSEVVDELAISSVAVKDYPSATFSGFLKRLRPKESSKAYPKYMALYLRSQLFRKAMDNNAVMTLRASFNEAIFSYLDVWLPDYDKQVEIGDLLYAIEEKTTLNNKINAELEAMAKLIYDYWFVQFDFPDENGKPYKSSGGKIVWCDQLKREIPDGWEVKSLSSLIKGQKTGEWGQEDETSSATHNVYCVRGADITNLNERGDAEFPSRFISEKKVGKQLDAYDLIVEISGGSPIQSTGRIALTPRHLLDRFEKPFVCSNFCKALTLKDVNYSYFFEAYWKMIYYNGNFFNWEGKTSGIKNLIFDAFVETNYIATPPKELAREFFLIADKWRQRRETGLQENRELAKLRDWLLPLLMNGQVTVGD